MDTLLELLNILWHESFGSIFMGSLLIMVEDVDAGAADDVKDGDDVNMSAVVDDGAPPDAGDTMTVGLGAMVIGVFPDADGC